LPCYNVKTPAGDYEVCMSDIKITGSGTISSTNPWQWWPCKYLPCRVDWRPHLIVFNKIERVTIEGVTLKDAPNHNVEVVESVTNRLHDLIFTAPYISPNTDGVNFYGGFDSVLKDSTIDNGDDCISGEIEQRAKRRVEIDKVGYESRTGLCLQASPMPL